MSKNGVMLINFDPASTVTDAEGRYHITDYNYFLYSGSWPLPADATRYTNDKGKLVQLFHSADMMGGDLKIVLMPSSPVNWAMPTVTLSFKNKTTGAGATPFTLANPTTIPFPSISYSSTVNGWYNDLTFASPPAMARYEYTISAVFSVNGVSRTYYIDPELDCSDNK
jgi:hypothetical protein